MRKILLTKQTKRVILLKIFEKGSKIMLQFVIRTTYDTNQTMHTTMHGLNVVCEYSGYEEK